MAWANSKIFSAFVTETVNRVLATSYDLDTHTIDVALFNNTTAPDQTVVLANTGYNTGVWVTGNEVTDATGWPAGGRPLASVSSTFTTNVYTFTAANTASVNSTTTLTNAFGCLVYDSGLTAKNGVCFNYFGGGNSITSGSFTVVWNASGIMTFTL